MARRGTPTFIVELPLVWCPLAMGVRCSYAWSWRGSCQSGTAALGRDVELTAPRTHPSACPQSNGCCRHRPWNGGHGQFRPRTSVGFPDPSHVSRRLASVLPTAAATAPTLTPVESVSGSRVRAGPLRQARRHRPRESRTERRTRHDRRGRSTPGTPCATPIDDKCVVQTRGGPSRAPPRRGTETGRCRPACCLPVRAELCVPRGAQCPLGA